MAKKTRAVISLVLTLSTSFAISGYPQNVQAAGSGQDRYVDLLKSPQSVERLFLSADHQNGSFRLEAEGRWIEVNSQGQTIFTFREIGRDEWSVYLHDDSRNVQIQIDLHRQMILYGENGGPRRDLCAITSSVAPERVIPAVIGTRVRLGPQEVVLNKTDTSVKVVDLSTGKTREIIENRSTDSRVPPTYAQRNGYMPAISTTTESRSIGSAETVADALLTEIKSNVDDSDFASYMDVDTSTCQQDTACQLRLRSTYLSYLEMK